MMIKRTSGKRAPRILRREDSLKSRQYRGICVRVLYECDGIEILRTEMESGSVLDDEDLASVSGLHFIIGGSPVFRIANQSNDLMPGDSIALLGGQHCTVSNPTAARVSILSFLFKRASACHSAGTFAQGVATSTEYEKEISR